MAVTVNREASPIESIEVTSDGGLKSVTAALVSRYIYSKGEYRERVMFTLPSGETFRVTKATARGLADALSELAG